MAQLQVGLTEPAPCHYLPSQQEQVLVVTDTLAHNDQVYEQLLSQGFRRSGKDIYRPYCSQCHACQPLGLAVNEFRHSPSQRRVRNKTQRLRWQPQQTLQPEHYPLYASYIEQRHASGGMYPPNEAHFSRFTQQAWLPQMFLEGWLDDQLVVVAVTDLLPNALSALYTFFAPELASLSLGTAAILKQIELAQQLGKSYLYLGYQIDECKEMNYKIKFNPHQKYLREQWLLGEK